MNKTAAFVMPVKLSGSEMELRHFKTAVESIKNQTDTNWILIMVEDFSDDERVYNAIDEIKEDLKDKLYVIYSDKNYGTGVTRNKGIALANELGAPFILFNDADDISHPRWLELVRKAFEDESVNVAYTSFDIIDENNNPVPLDKINLSVREILEGHQIDVVEGENAFVNIASKKKYTNLTSCTAVRTSLAVAEPFPNQSVSEDCNTWMRYGAHPGKFFFIREIKGCYRICTGVASRSRSKNEDFYEKMFNADIAGFEAGLKLAEKYSTMGDWTENDLRCAFHVRLALCLIHGGDEEYSKKSIKIAAEISKENALHYIDLLQCEDETKEKLKAFVS
ncbi:MAG: glycosyltransferase family 2 protein [Ruminococcaceae bacterium]|nr:glycosyltransferase family 2 protein [Oscillospiraceae bacterium]